MGKKKSWNDTPNGYYSNKHGKPNDANEQLAGHLKKVAKASQDAADAIPVLAQSVEIVVSHINTLKPIDWSIGGYVQDIDDFDFSNKIMKLKNAAPIYVSKLEYASHWQSQTWFDNSLGVISDKSERLPGMFDKVKLPASVTTKINYPALRLKSAIMILNDECGWSREQIADWLDELADRGEINIDFG